jgi:glycosyltransferase involved in cell wall biosynthesis
MVGKNYLSADLDGLCRADRDWCREFEHYKLGAIKQFPAYTPERKRVLLIDDLYPDPGRDAGSSVVISHVRALIRLGFDVYFFAVHERSCAGPMADKLRHLGCVPVGLPEFSFEKICTQASKTFHAIYVHRMDNAAKLSSAVTGSTAKIVYCLVDLHSLRLKRQAEVESNESLLREAEMIQRIEFDLIKKADAVVTYSSFEADLINTALSDAHAHVIPWDAQVAEAPLCNMHEKAIGFIGGYCHRPNVDAVQFLLNDVAPKVFERDSEITFSLAGSNMPQYIKDISMPWVKIVGYVDDLHSFLGSCCCTVAPLRYGAGIKGKVLDSLAAGVPCVMTTVAAEGLNLPASLRSLVTQNAEQLAETIVSLANDRDRLRSASTEALQFMKSEFSPSRIDQLLQEVFGIGIGN